MNRVVVLHGNAVVPYTVAADESFHTEFAARLFGWLTCAAAGQYHHWSLQPEGRDMGRAIREAAERTAGWKAPR